MAIDRPQKKSSLREKVFYLFRQYTVPRWLIFLFDGSTVLLTFFVSYLLRFNFESSGIDFALAFKQSILVFAVYCGYELLFRSFSELIRHTTVKDIFKVIQASTSGLLTLILITLINRYSGRVSAFNIPLSILLIHFVTLNIVLFSVRIAIKMFYEFVTPQRKGRKNVIIFGAGSMGTIVSKVMAEDTSGKYNIKAFVDNNMRLHGKKLNGIPVFSPKYLSKEFLRKHHISTMIFAIKDIQISEKRGILKFGLDMGLEVLDIPPVQEWWNDQFQMQQLHPIRVEDLLRRDTIQMNLKAIEEGLKGKTILVTGAAGSIGSEIVRQLRNFDVEKLVLIDSAETPMFHLNNELQEAGFGDKTRTFLADVTDQIKMQSLFDQYRPEMVFHAAAYKHVPLLESNPHEALRVNVRSTMVLTKLSQTYGVEKFVMVSTDKAVNPTNIMGASKRMCEMILQARSVKPGNEVQFVITRFGNVLGSNGSVIPIFQKQIEEGGPVKVTHPEITRYFMTIPEACQLVLEAAFLGMGGEIYVFDMGDPVKIDELARDMIRLSGYTPDKEIKIVYTGLRPGEKLYEELLAHKEKTLPTYNPKVKVAEVSWINHEKVLSDIHSLLYEVPGLRNTEVAARIKQVVPEFESSNAAYAFREEQAPGEASKELEIYPD
ncbi:MAG: hypothetical protein CSA96_07320 [Bacteroidetes bacterium]|nr:MAG: hypothetical protein CSA96_07320 [Bacteroidota bacterium]